MKKRLLFLFFICIFIYGCGNSSLKCQKSVKNSAGENISSVQITFKDDTPIKVNIKNIMSTSNNSDMMVKAMKNSLKNYEGKNGVNISFNNSNGKIISSISIDYSKVLDEDKSIIGYDNIISMEKAKAFYESQGFDCK